MKNMTIYELFADQSSSLSNDNYNEIRRNMESMVKTSDNNKVRVNNILKKFTPYYKDAKRELNIISDGSEVSQISRNTRRSKVSKKTK